MSSNKKSTKWDGKSKATGTAFKMFYTILKRFGLKGAYFVLYFVAAYYWLFDYSARKHIAWYYRHIWGYGWWKTQRMLYKTFYTFGQTILDKVAVFNGRTDYFTFDFNGRHYLDDLRNSGHGALLISAHLGNWEIAGHFLEKAQNKVHVIMLDAEHEAIKDVLAEALNNRSFHVIALKEDRSHLFQLHQAFRDNDFICIHGDRILNPDQDRSEEAELFGRRIRLPRGPFELAVRFKMPYLYVFAIKEKNQHYQFYAFKGSAEAEGDVHHMMQEYTRYIEEILTPNPEQWFNFFDFWESDAHQSDTGVQENSTEHSLS